MQPKKIAISSGITNTVCSAVNAQVSPCFLKKNQLNGRVALLVINSSNWQSTATSVTEISIRYAKITTKNNKYVHSMCPQSLCTSLNASWNATTIPCTPSANSDGLNVPEAMEETVSLTKSAIPLLANASATCPTTPPNMVAANATTTAKITA